MHRILDPNNGSSVKDDPKIITLCDVPYLLKFKSFRNQLISGNIKTPDGIVSWRIISELYVMDKLGTTRMCPKLTEKHIYPKHFYKIKVKLATQVFSRSVVAGIKTAHQLEKFTSGVQNDVVPTINFFEKLEIEKLENCSIV